MILVVCKWHNKRENRWCIGEGIAKPSGLTFRQLSVRPTITNRGSAPLPVSRLDSIADKWVLIVDHIRRPGFYDTFANASLILMLFLPLTYYLHASQSISCSSGIWRILNNVSIVKMMRRIRTSLETRNVGSVISLDQQWLLMFTKYMHHMRMKAIFIPSWAIWFNYKRVWRGTYSMSYPWKEQMQWRAIINSQRNVHSVSRTLEKVWRKFDNMHMYQAIIRMDMKWSITKQDNTFAHFVRSVICNCLSTRITNCQSISTMDRIMISHSSWNWSHRTHKRTLAMIVWKWFQQVKTRKCKLNTVLINSKIRWNWSAAHSRP